MTIFIGVDPGLTGALAFVHLDHGLIGLHDMPTIENDAPTAKGFRKEIDVQGLRELIRKTVPAQDTMTAVLESSGIFGPSVHTTVSIAESRAYTLATLRLMSIDVRRVTPQVWKRMYGLSSDKDECLDKARTIFGTVGFERKRDHNRAEAALIAHYGRRMFA